MRTITKHMLIQLNEKMPTIKSIELVSDFMTPDEWVDLGKPYVWKLVEENNGFQAAIDRSAGTLALFKDDVLVAFGVNTISTDNCVMIDPSYHNMLFAQYLWF